MERVSQTLGPIPVQRPKPTASRPQHQCQVMGYVGQPLERDACDPGYTPPVPHKANQPPMPSHHGETRRWKMERAHS